MNYYVRVEPWGVYVKTEKFFLSQQGDKCFWGKRWQKVQAKSIEDARVKASTMQLQQLQA